MFPVRILTVSRTCVRGYNSSPLESPLSFAAIQTTGSGLVRFKFVIQFFHFPPVLYTSNAIIHKACNRRTGKRLHIDRSVNQRYSESAAEGRSERRKSIEVT